MRRSLAGTPTPAGASAEKGLQDLELGRDLIIPHKPSGSGPSSSGAPDASGDATAAADVPTSELALQRAWWLVDGVIAFFLCMSIVHFIIRLTVTAGLCVCIGIATVLAHLCKRIQSRGDHSAKALYSAMDTYFVVQFLPGCVTFVGFLILIARGKCASDLSDCPFRPVHIVTYCYCITALGRPCFRSRFWLPMKKCSRRQFKGLTRSSFGRSIRRCLHRPRWPNRSATLRNSLRGRRERLCMRLVTQATA